MANEKSFIIRGTAGYCAITAPVSRHAKFHTGQFKVQIQPIEIPAEISDIVSEKLKETATPDGNNIVNTLTLYSQYYIKAFVNGARARQTDIMRNPIFGENISVQVKVYENRYGKQLAIQAVELPYEVLECENPF